MTRWLETDTLSDQNIATALAIGVYTANADRSILCQFVASQLAGAGDYIFYLTLQINGAGSIYVLLPKTTGTAASGETAIGGQSIIVNVRSGDILTAYLDGLAGDTTTPDTIVRWFELAALRPTTADLTLDVSAGGEAGIDWANVGTPGSTVALSATTVKTATDVESDTVDIQGRIPAALNSGNIKADVLAISGDAVAADNLEAMLDGTGGITLTLKKLIINNPDVSGIAIDIDAGGVGGQGVVINTANDGIVIETSGGNSTGIYISGGGRGIWVLGNANQAIYLATDAGAATVYIEGPTSGGKALALSSPTAGAGDNVNASGIFIETEAGHPGILIKSDGPGIKLQPIGGDGLVAIGAGAGHYDINADIHGAIDGLTAAQIADAVLDELLTDHTTSNSLSAGITSLLSRIGSFTGSGINTVLGFFKAVMGKLASTPSDVGDTFSAGTDSLEAIRDSLTTAVTSQVSTSYALEEYRGDTWALLISGLGSLADYVSLDFTLKNSIGDVDADAIVRIRKNASGLLDGLLVKNGSSTVTAGNGSITISDAVAGNIIINLVAADVDDLVPADGLYYDVQKIGVTGNVAKVDTLRSSVFNVLSDVTRTVV